MYNIKDNRGVLVKEVVEGSIAAGLGFQEEDIIRSINRRTITGLEDYKKLIQSLRPGSQVLFIIERRGELYYLAIVV
jgi:S1-C subfamily serine protease